MNYQKGMEIKSITKVDFVNEVKKEKSSLEVEKRRNPTKKEPHKKKEITITSDDVEYFD